MDFMKSAMAVIMPVAAGSPATLSAPLKSIPTKPANPVIAPIIIAMTSIFSMVPSANGTLLRASTTLVR